MVTLQFLKEQSIDTTVQKKLGNDPDVSNSVSNTDQKEQEGSSYLSSSVCIFWKL